MASGRGKGWKRASAPLCRTAETPHYAGFAGYSLNRGLSGCRLVLREGSPSGPSGRLPRISTRAIERPSRTRGRAAESEPNPSALFAPGQIISRSHSVTEMHENEMGTLIVDSAVHWHQDLGPGLLETVYEVSLAANL